MPPLVGFLKLGSWVAISSGNSRVTLNFVESRIDKLLIHFDNQLLVPMEGVSLVYTPTPALVRYLSTTSYQAAGRG